MVTLRNKRENRVGDGRCTTGVEHTTCAAFNLNHCFLKREVSCGATTSVKQGFVGAIDRRLVFLCDRIKHHSRSALYWGVNHAKCPFFVASRGNEAGLFTF
ncbi:Uncharacterised protein [Vibrio cholerae]|uniref:Uncharacterized protein n=1 Tax=Vibrio cholerae TaxID=666 RepID=A0A655XEY3_VIBCL|nr:Uncharacterised protein [Vibrio cholerae]